MRAANSYIEIIEEHLFDGYITHIGHTLADFSPGMSSAIP